MYYLSLLLDAKCMPGILIDALGLLLDYKCMYARFTSRCKIYPLGLLPNAKCILGLLFNANCIRGLILRHVTWHEASLNKYRTCLIKLYQV